MAATAASIGSSFSTSMQTHKAICSKSSSFDHLLKTTLYRPILHLSGLTSQFMPIESPSHFAQRWRLLAVDIEGEGEGGEGLELEGEGEEGEGLELKGEGEEGEGLELEGEGEEGEGLELEGEGEGLELEGEGEGDKLSSEEAESSSSGGMNTKLYFGNLPYNCDSAQLAGIIQDYASPELIEVLYDRATGRSRGFAFAIMSSIEDCNAVIENLDGCQFGGRTLRVNFSDKPKVKEPLYPETEHKLFVGNLAWSVTSEILTKAFEEESDVVGARVLYDGETGRSRGYGFVSYSTKSEMDSALESMNGVELEGRAIRVSHAEGKKR